MLFRCWGCGVEKDTDVHERYAPDLDKPEDERRLTDQPIAPLFFLDCQGPLEKLDADPAKQETMHRLGAPRYCEFRFVIVCHQCFDKLDPDMWISDGCWEGISPRVPYEALPRIPPDRSSGGAGGATYFEEDFARWIHVFDAGQSNSGS